MPLLVPATVVALPLLDGVLAIIRRARRRRSIFHADKEHLHHRLMDLGHGHRQAVIVMYMWSALGAGAALAFTFFDRQNLLFALPIAVASDRDLHAVPGVDESLRRPLRLTDHHYPLTRLLGTFVQLTTSTVVI